MLDTLKSIIRKSSIHMCLLNTGGCNGCDIEIIALLSPRYDLEQYGIYFHNNPREADVILITGPVAEQWKENLERVYSKIPNPKVVIAVGACCLTGHLYNQEGNCVYPPLDEFIPVDATIPGCPPRPSEILQVLLDVGRDAIAAKGRQK
ncbi:MAG: NADH-quinone oxidoreductase subunit B family protein [Methanobacteriaceae archaeon]|jgi:energy-converting hydrogenase A subunit N